MTTSSSQNEIQQCLFNARFEVLPLRGTAEQVRGLPVGTTVTITSSPGKGIDATLNLAADLSGQGMHPVPHLSARLVRDTRHLSALLDRIEDLGISEVFVVAGDPPDPAGEFPDALSLLRAMDDLGRKPAKVGITGYPEPHAFISDTATIQSMSEKSRYADYIVSQICFDPEAIAAWIRQVRDRGMLLPIHIGSPGAIDVTKLLRISLKIGLGESMRYLRKQHGMVGKLLGRYSPDDLFQQMSPYLLDPYYGVAGWHFFTFNEVGKTIQWRQEMAARMQEVPA